MVKQLHQYKYCSWDIPEQSNATGMCFSFLKIISRGWMFLFYSKGKTVDLYTSYYLTLFNKKLLLKTKKSKQRALPLC